MPSTLRALIVGAVLALVASGCTDGGPPASDGGPTPGTGSPSATASPASGGELRVMLRYDPEFIDPGFVIEAEGAQVVNALFDGLLAYDDRLGLVPAVATGHEVDATSTVFTFHLDPAARFHDGTPVDADSFIRGWNRLVDGTADEISPNAHHLTPVAGYEEARRDGTPLSGLTALDPRTLQVTLRYPFADFPAVVAHPALSPIPAVALADVAAFREAPIGNGPFRMAGTWQHDEFIRVQRFDGHVSPPLLDEVVFRIYSGEGAEEAAYADFQQGLLHVAAVPRERLGAAVEQFGEAADGYSGPGVLTGGSLFVYYYGFNTQVAPFDDPDVRRGLSLLIDREALAAQVMGGTRIAATSLVPTGVPGAQPGTCTYCVYDPEQARVLLEGKDLTGLTITFNDHPVQRAIANRVAADIEAQLGVDVALRGVPFGEYLDDIRAGDIGLFRLGWEAEYPTMDNFIWSHVDSAARGDTNLFGFSDPDGVDALLSQARATTDPAARYALYIEAERTALDQVPLSPMLFYRQNRVVAQDVVGYVLRPNGGVDLTRVRVTGR